MTRDTPGRHGAEGATHEAAHVLGGLLRTLAGDANLVDEVVEAARAASPEVARLPEAENRRHIAVVVAAAIAQIEHAVGPGDTGASEGLDKEVYAAAEALGADRAMQGIPIEALLRGVHAGRTRAVDIAVTRGRAEGISADAILDALVWFNRYAGALERHVISGHRRAELELSRTARDAHTHVLRRLLHGADDLTDDEITRAGLRPDGQYCCVLSDVSDPVRARALEQRLAVLGGVYGLVEGRLAGLSPRVPTEPTDALVVVAPSASLREVRTRYDLCLTAIRAAGNRRGVHHLTDLAGETALAAQPVLAALLTTEYLGSLDPADHFHRQLVSTALTYLDHSQRVDQTAEALHVHPNTVRYRLGKLTELTGAGPTPTTVLDTLRWWWALRTWLRPG
ncbi:PucR family transcriptional regulator [Actinophytocola sp.]|uniref:PucR family transcriptional regulator n=1 Tax=Actinophytocola sp. TaxID=1872138 RepID=UPI002ED1B667